MVFKKLLQRFKKDDEQYPNRFLKFYHRNKKRLNKERRSSYSEKKEKGICVRCNKRALKNIVFCGYHKKKQVTYNKKARTK